MFFGQLFAKRTESEAGQENSSNATSVSTKIAIRTTVLMVVVIVVKMLTSPHRPPFLDVVEDADDEDGGGHQEQQHDQQDLRVSFKIREVLPFLPSRTFSH